MRPLTAVPWHVVRPGRALIRGQIHVLIQPGICLSNLVRIRGCSQYLSDQRVRIESNRGHQLIQLHRIQIDVRSRRGRLCVHQSCCQNQQRRKPDCDPTLLALSRYPVKAEIARFQMKIDSP
jgi:hypothetical protein